VREYNIRTNYAFSPADRPWIDVKAVAYYTDIDVTEDRFIDGRRFFLIHTGRQRAAQRLARPIGHGFREVLQHRAFAFCQKRERFAQDVPLEFGVARLAERPAEREVAMQRARRLQLLRVRTHERQNDGRQAFGFKNMSERTHGARAERSDRGEQNDIHPGLLQELRRQGTRVVPD